MPPMSNSGLQRVDDDVCGVVSLCENAQWSIQSFQQKRVKNTNLHFVRACLSLPASANLPVTKNLMINKDLIRLQYLCYYYYL